MDQEARARKGQIGDFYKGRFAAKDSELLDELGKIARQWRPPAAGALQEEDTRLPAYSVESVSFSDISAVGAIHQFAGAVEMFFEVRAWASPARAPERSSLKSASQLSAVGCPE